MKKSEKDGITTWYFTNGVDIGEVDKFSDVEKVSKNNINDLEKTSSVFDVTAYTDDITPILDNNDTSLDPDHKAGATKTYQLRKRYHLYVLLLNNDTYYVGLTSRSVKKRLMEHSGLGFYEGARYTALHGVKQLVDTYDLGEATYTYALKKENQLTRKYINNYGVVKVRGGKWCRSNNFTHAIDYYTRYIGGINGIYSFLFIICISISYVYVIFFMSD